ncbi:MAG TPA: chemotaxis protein CheB [Flavisolibacter sp.]|jgi:two-component system chemotaxis response regulator CheB|nr:chemotaxis protein CheB [Flavisolibacter sp.]
MEESKIKSYKVIAIGGSAGSLDIVLKIVAALPAATTSVLVLILHRKTTADSVLQYLLSSRTSLSVKEVEDKEPIQAGTIYIAPPDYHLLVEDKHTFALDSSEKVQYSRPSIDVSFESIAACFGTDALGILLSGANADGAEGMAAIKAGGGYTIAQDPASADVGYMPQQAINLGVVDEVLDVINLESKVIQYLKKI